LGLSALGAGGAAVFISSNSAGTGVLLAVGALFGFMGFTGTPISRARIGNLEVEAARVLRRGLRSPKPEIKEEVAALVLDSALPPSNPIRREAEMVSAVAEYERHVFAAVSRVTDTPVTRSEVEDQRIDGTVEYQGHRIGIELKYASRPGSVAIQQTINHALFVLGAGHGQDLDKIVIVSNRASTSDRVRVQQDPRLRLVVWESPSDDDALREALQR